MSCRRKLGGTIALILLAHLPLAVQTFGVSPEEAREILRASREESPPDIDALTRLLDGPDEEVRAAAEEALVAAGEPCVKRLNGLLEDPGIRIGTKQRVAAVLGRIGHPESVRPLCDFLVHNRVGGTNHDIALSSLAEIGAPSVEPLLRLLRYRTLQRGIYLSFLEQDRSELRTSLMNIIHDNEADPSVRILAAETVEEFLGTSAVYYDVMTFYYSEATASFPADQRDRAKKNASELHSRRRDEAFQPLTREMIMTKFDALDAQDSAAETRAEKEEANEERWQDIQRENYDRAKHRKERELSSGSKAVRKRRCW